MWGADVYPGQSWRNYTVDFQVWRPSPTVDSTDTACYSLVGNNRFTLISIHSFLARATPLPQDYIQFQPGDVLGFYMESDEDASDDIIRGQELWLIEATIERQSQWHSRIEPNEATHLREGCPYPQPAIVYHFDSCSTCHLNSHRYG